MSARHRSFGLLAILAIVGACARAPDPTAVGNAQGGASGGGRGQTSSLSTNEEVRRAYADASGRTLSDDACIERPGSFPSIVMVGGFAHDRGCSMESLFIDGKLQDRTSAGSWSLRTLETVGFVAAERARQEEIARLYVDEVVHAFGGRFVTATGPAFELEDTPAFTPVAVADHHEGFVIRGWTRRPSGMVDESGFLFMEYAFAPNGQVTATRGETFTVPGDRLR